MALTKIKDYNPHYKDEIFQGEDIKGYDVYADNDNKVGSVHDILVDESGRIRYFVIDTGFWIFGKKVLLPVGRSRIDYNNHNLYALGLNKDQAENLPRYDDNMTVDYDYEERVRTAYRNPQQTTAANYTPNDYHYDREPELYGVREGDHGSIKLYEERLIANKERHKTGEVAVGKRVETETAKASVPVEKERVVIERTTPTNAGERVAPGEADFREGEVARMEVYEENADIHKEAVVREEVKVKKTVERDTVSAEETLRREELDIDTKGEPNINRNR